MPRILLNTWILLLITGHILSLSCIFSFSLPAASAEMFSIEIVLLSPISFLIVRLFYKNILLPLQGIYKASLKCLFKQAKIAYKA